MPDATDLAAEVGLASDLVSPEPVGAAVWYDGLHRIPDGLLLGVPGRLAPLATTELLSWRGKLRAGSSRSCPARPSRPTRSVRSSAARFGDEVQERLVDALVGSIYATDTDHFSLREVPQLYDVARQERSLLLGASVAPERGRPPPARRRARVRSSPRPAVESRNSRMPTADAVRHAGGLVRTSSAVGRLSAEGADWSIDGEAFDAVIIATPARVAGSLLSETAPAGRALLGRAETADVVMVTLHVPAGEWPDRLRGLSGYLVPKPVQRSVTAVSFGSQKWAHWRPPAGGEILRVSVGRDGVSPLDRTRRCHRRGAVLDDLRAHLGVRFTPLEVRVTRWPGAFAQYRPHHHGWVDVGRTALPRRLVPRRVELSGHRDSGVHPGRAEPSPTTRTAMSWARHRRAVRCRAVDAGPFRRERIRRRRAHGAAVVVLRRRRAAVTYALTAKVPVRPPPATTATVPSASPTVAAGHHDRRCRRRPARRPPPATTTSTATTTTATSRRPRAGAASATRPIAPPQDPERAEALGESARSRSPRSVSTRRCSRGSGSPRSTTARATGPARRMPGQVGNVVVAGHRTSHSAQFRHLDQLVPGDVVTFTTPDGVFDYTVTTHRRSSGPDAHVDHRPVRDPHGHAVRLPPAGLDTAAHRRCPPRHSVSALRLTGRVTAA